MLLHYIIFHYSNGGSWQLSVGVGFVLAAAIFLIFVSPSKHILNLYPLLSRSKYLDVINFGIGGGVYGWLYYSWVAKGPKTKVH
ncbi:hypothetical protein SAMN00120144_2362 [Hymenobacter roseosalivarius DSM 11622]|uniref:Uncharacterized protein n=1 Tax=Hymenobacter roseosalivarius DSM 11622 TaxID=645990 RepID=A0A1W1VLJ4_9BACT|nr:hypothetical protein SAMN00120144_2362 [Hymenobacter roseosalivarius DSM 11622]